jgi:hypothetical protein
MISIALTAAALVARLITPSASPADDWQTMPCTSGNLSAERSTSSPDQFIIPGSIGCMSKLGEEKYAVAVFYPGEPRGYITEKMFLEYPSEMTSRPHEFHVFEEIRTHLGPKPDALCLVSDLHTRISCVHVDIDENDVRTVKPLPVDSPVVTVDIVVAPLVEIEPECATCRQLLPGDPPPTGGRSVRW